MSNVEFWLQYATVDWISSLFNEKEMLESKKQAAIKYIDEQMFQTHYGYVKVPDMPWWITALEIINNIPISRNKVVMDDIERQIGFELVEETNTKAALDKIADIVRHTGGAR